ncbi:ABC transporter substrate-binding protein [Nocardioides kongjuensis]|uniref:Polar amino acid transport system substrate-binding protein n=1 Tax=Nocardioides kongjuensis TaxID=349522 RepID=A0A852RRZ0_9ACTN|nr:ABC transporter substrate-binding protein [Nocardioides kongjuensis]NYD31640.1 polar amino acid transport system substrate-binding protein [Nocardioides kongjuensis]
MNIRTLNRRTMARRGVAGAALGAVLLSAAACGSSGGDGSEKARPKADSALAGLVPADIAEKGTVVVGTQPDFEPANFTPIGESEIKGFNVDLMDAMAAKLGLKVEWQKVPFDQLLIGMQSGKFDAAIAGMTDRKERQAQVDFIDYQVAGTVFMVQKGNPKGITSEVDGGCGIKIGDVKGSDAKRLVDMMAAACVQAGKPPTKLVSFPSSSDKNLALVSGRVDAMFWPDMAVSVINRETDDKLESLPVNFEPKVYLGMTFSKDDSELRDAFFAALEAIHEDGTYDEILKKWDVEVIDLPTPGINLATS